MKAKNFSSFKNYLIKERKEFRLLIKEVPSVLLILFTVAVVCMNLMANKSIALPFDFLVLDCGIIVSWFVFLALDILTKHFGPKAATQLSLFATGMNVIVCIFFYILSIIPGTWGEAYLSGYEEIIENALNNTFGGTWYIILGSMIAFCVSAMVNNFVNYFVGLSFRKNPDSLTAYMCRSYVSTSLGQFADNFVFALLVSRIFFGWSLSQCLICSLFGMLAELVLECIFSVFGWKISEKWRINKVGEKYLKGEKEC